jgi:hypothetical protein
MAGVHEWFCIHVRFRSILSQSRGDAIFFSLALHFTIAAAQKCTVLLYTPVCSLKLSLLTKIGNHSKSFDKKETWCLVNWWLEISGMTD